MTDSIVGLDVFVNGSGLLAAALNKNLTKDSAEDVNSGKSSTMFRLIKNKPSLTVLKLFGSEPKISSTVNVEDENGDGVKMLEVLCPAGFRVQVMDNNGRMLINDHSGSAGYHRTEVEKSPVKIILRQKEVIGG